MNFDWGKVAERGTAMRASLLNSTALNTAKAFGRNEDGAGSLLSFYTFLMLLLLAGLGVDTMRHEMERTHLQATLDAAVLAGAGASSGSNSQVMATIVSDYFDKNGMSEYLNEIDLDNDIETTLTSTRVFASADMEIDTYLLQMTGVETLRAKAAAEAQVQIPKLEVSLVLDVSGSMAGDKLDDLQEAAKSFVTTILGQADPGDTFISVVPFAWNVTPSDEIFDALTVNKTHEYSTCLRFADSDYQSAAIDPDVSVDLGIYTSNYDDGFGQLDEWYRSCYDDDNAEILPYSMSVTALHTHIDALTADGNTSAHIGMKWGAALLDDEFQDVATALQADGVDVVDDRLENIPSVYGEAETLKVIVLMADGDNTTSYYFDAAGDYRGPNSDLYKVTWQDMTFDYAWRVRRNGSIRTSDEEWRCSRANWNCEYKADGDAYSAYYIFDENNDRYLDVEASQNVPNKSDGFRDKNKYVWISDDDFEDFEDITGENGGQTHISTEALSWELAWGLISPDLHRDVTGSDALTDYETREFDDGGIKDQLMQDICTATKNEGVVVFTIGYDIAEDGNAETQLEDCASSMNHYYPTNGVNIDGTFNSIASNVKNLRLTQ